jgi:hypothetical protein
MQTTAAKSPRMNSKCLMYGSQTYYFLNAVSLAVDWKFAAKFDAYAGFMYSQVNNGLADGFLHRTAIDPTVGIRFQF